MNCKSYLPLLLAIVVISCEAENETITSTLFDMSAANSSVVTGSVNMRNGSIRIQSSIAFFDSGGPSSNYANNETLVLTIYPAKSGDRIAMTLNFFNIENSDGCIYDALEIYNGTSTTAPRIDSWCGTADSFWIPFYFVADNNAGALTLRFKSDGSDTGPGWSANLLPLAPTTGYSISLARATGLTGNSSRLNYTVLGPSLLPTDQGFCISTTNTVPSRTNGANCFTANVNRYGTRVFVQPSLGGTQTHYMRAFVTPPGSSTLYTSTVTYAPLGKALPQEFNRGLIFDEQVQLGPLN
jgi:hypothetical protein